MQPNMARSRRKEGEPKSAPDELAGFDDALWRLNRVIQFRDRDRICCAGLTVSQGHALELIARTPGMRLVDLAERLHLDKSTATRVTAALVALGYVRRSPAPADARASLLACTVKGKRAHAELRALLAMEHLQLVAELSERERATVTSVLTRLANLLERRERTPSVMGEPDCCPKEQAHARFQRRQT